MMGCKDSIHKGKPSTISAIVDIKVREAEGRCLDKDKLIADLQAENERLKALCTRESLVLGEALKRSKNNKSMIAVVAASLKEEALKDQ